MTKPIALALLVVVHGIVLVDAAQAYVDPGSGSMLLQLLLGGVAGAVVLVKYYWHRLRTLLGFQERE
jgi:hypothetical protein